MAGGYLDPSLPYWDIPNPLGYFGIAVQRAPEAKAMLEAPCRRELPVAGALGNRNATGAWPRYSMLEGLGYPNSPREIM